MRGWSLCLGVAVAALVGTARAEGPPLPVGIGLSHVKAQCTSDATGPRRDSGVQPQDNIILNYGQPPIRTQTQAALADMRRQGASILRATLWFHHAEDERMARRRDGLGQIEAVQGRLPDKAISNLVGFATDAREAGYGVFAIAIGAEGHANPKCRQNETYGACYQPELFDLSWRVTDQVAAALRPLERSGFKVLIDISPENCPNDRAGPLLEKNETDFTREMVVRYAKAYGTGFFVSCGGRPVSRGLAGLKSLAGIYRQAGVQPSAVDVHMYDSEPGDIDAVLGAADRMARSYRAPLYVLETYADNRPLYAEASRLKAIGRTPSLAGVAMWPKNAADACHISLTPPYDLKRLTGG